MSDSKESGGGTKRPSASASVSTTNPPTSNASSSSGSSSRNSSASPSTKRSKSKKDLKDKPAVSSEASQSSPSSTPPRKGPKAQPPTDPDQQTRPFPSHNRGSKSKSKKNGVDSVSEVERVAETVDFFMSGSFDDNSIEFSLTESDLSEASSSAHSSARANSVGGHGRGDYAASLSDIDDEDEEDEEEDDLAAVSDVDTNDETDDEDPSLRTAMKGRSRPVVTRKQSHHQQHQHQQHQESSDIPVLKHQKSSNSITRSGSNVSLTGATLKHPQIVFKEIPGFVVGAAPHTQLISFATVEGLLSMLADQTAVADKTFIDTCILTYDYFMDSASFLRKVLNQYQTPRLNAHLSWTVAGAPDPDALRKARADEQNQLQQIHLDASQPESNALVVFQLRYTNITQITTPDHQLPHKRRPSITIQAQAINHHTSADHQLPYKRIQPTKMCLMCG